MIQFTDRNIWTGRMDDEDGELGSRWHQMVQYGNFANLEAINQPNIALLGFCSDEGVRRNKGRIGAKDSPDIIRKSLAGLPYNFNSKKKIFDFGNIVLENQDLESARQEQAECVAELIEKNYFPIILGGGHETAFGNFLGLAKDSKDIGIINIDAHFDVRIPVEHSTSGTPFFEMSQYCQNNEMKFNYFAIGIQPTGNTQALFTRAKILNAHHITADEVHTDLNYVLRKLGDFMLQHETIYLSLDLDVLDAAFAPGVSAPCANGLTPFQVKSIIKKVIEFRKVELFDVVEYNPLFDLDSRTAKLAAQFINEFI